MTEDLFERAREAFFGTGKTLPGPDNSGGLKRSTQHWSAVYPPEFEIPRFVVAGY